MVEPVRITQDFSAGEQLLYFTSTSLTGDDKGLVFISDRTGDPNLFYRDMVSGTERQLTRNERGMLKSYVYFEGRPYEGLGKGSVSFDPVRGVVYYIQGREIRAVDLMGRERVVAEYPQGQMTAFTHVSADGTRLCVPTTDARALDGEALLAGKPAFDIDGRVQEEGLSSYLRVYDTATGKELLAERVEKSWITHVQFSPVDAELILYNHEWPGDCGIRRMWLWDGERHVRLRAEGEGRRRSDWTCHEMWERDGGAIIYHGTYNGRRGPAYLGRILVTGKEVSANVEVGFDPRFIKYGHFTVGRPGWLVSDGYFEEGVAEGKHGCGEWITLQRVDWEKRTVEWRKICRSGSSWDSQDAHPHPIFNHAGDAVYFTSDKDGKRAVWRVEVEEVMGR